MSLLPLPRELVTSEEAFHLPAHAIAQIPNPAATAAVPRPAAQSEGALPSSSCGFTLPLVFQPSLLRVVFFIIFPNPAATAAVPRPAAGALGTAPNSLVPKNDAF